MPRTLSVRGMAIATGAAILLLHMPHGAGAQEDHSSLNRESYRRKCLMCHSRSAPEGVSPEILAGLHPEPGLPPAVAMPGVSCWRRCTTCWPKDLRSVPK
ncbi:hypothetical protein [Sphingobium olei]|uniref:Cytochrome c domain-containing protein n=2 Tax=Sphingobium olei TaxID=420955 RepID=A0ABW3NX51_9SPHN